MSLELGRLRKAIQALDRSLQAAERAQGMDLEFWDTIQAGVILRFGMTYELSWKFMKRWIQEQVGATQVDGVTRRELFRQAAENRLIEDVNAWMDHHAARNLTSHTHDEATAQEVFEASPALLKNAKALLCALETRND